MEDRKFVDISYIVEKQYRKFQNWVDLVTVHANVNPDVIQKLSCVLLVSDMSNNSYYYWKETLALVEKYPSHIIGFITQNRYELEGFYNMTPGVRIEKTSSDEGDQKWRDPSKIDTDIMIVGRGIYQDPHPEEAAERYVKCVV